MIIGISNRENPGKRGESGVIEVFLGLNSADAGDSYASPCGRSGGFCAVSKISDTQKHKFAILYI